jgi:large subunit ribosomal protein L10
MNKQEKNDVIEVLKEKFSQYNNFYITDTESLSVAQVTNLRRTCFDKQVEMRVAKNTLIRKALESLDAEKYSGVFDALHNVTALMFSENPKEPALIISSFRKKGNAEKPKLKAAFINGDIYIKVTPNSMEFSRNIGISMPTFKIKLGHFWIPLRH